MGVLGSFGVSEKFLRQQARKMGITFCECLSQYISGYYNISKEEADVEAAIYIQ